MGAPEVLAQVWGWSLLHFLWQGCLLGGLAWVALRLLKNTSPEARYAVACLGLVAMLAAPVATALVLRRAASAPAVAATAATSKHVLVDVEAAVVSPSTPSLSVRLQPALPWVLGAWALGVALLSLRLLGGWVWMQRLRHAKAIRAGVELQTLVRVLSRRIGLARDVLLLICDRIESPVALGWIRPVILIPPALLAGLDPLALEAILLHELAHIRRQDYLVNLLQSFAETLLFYHPAVWWLSAVIRQERENACDDTAIRLTGDAVAYAHTLSLLEEFRMNRHSKLHSTPAPAANGGSLLARVRRILSPAPATAPLAPRAAVLGLLAAGLLGAASAAPPVKEDEKPAEKKTVKEVVVMTHEGKAGDGPHVRITLKQGTKMEDLRKDFSLMAPGSSVSITEQGRAFTAKRSKEGAYTETYTVDGKIEPITGDVRTWAQGKLPDHVRVHSDHGAKVVVGDDKSVVVSKDGHSKAHVIVIRKKGGEGGGHGANHGDGPHVFTMKRGGADPDFDMDFDFEPGDFKWTPELKEKLEKHHKEMTPEMRQKMEKLHQELGGKMRIEMKELQKLHHLGPEMHLKMDKLHKELTPELRAEMEKLHGEMGEGKMKTFVFRSGDSDFTWDEGQPKELGQKARMQALKGLANSLAKDASDPETKAALGRIQAELEALEAKTKK